MKACLICSGKPKFQITLQERMFGTNEKFLYNVCSYCESLYIEDTINDSEYYKDNYYSLSSKTINTSTLNKILNIKRAQSYFQISSTVLGNILNYIKPFPLKYLKPSDIETLSCKILDIGCGDGKLLSYLETFGFNNLYGVDPFILDEKNSLNIKITKGDVFSLIGLYDVIMSHHSIEHVDYPKQFIKKLLEHLSPDGVIVIRTPFLDSYAWNNFRENWIQLDPPRHKFIISMKAINYLANELNFKIESISCDSKEFQFWGSIQFQNGMSLFDKDSLVYKSYNSIVSKKELMNFRKQAEKLNKLQKGDQIIIRIKK